MYNSNLELRVFGDKLRISFENFLTITIHHEEIFKEACNLGGSIVNESLIMFSSSTALMDLVSFIATL